MDILVEVQWVLALSAFIYAVGRVLDPVGSYLDTLLYNRASYKKMEDRIRELEVENGKLQETK